MNLVVYTWIGEHVWYIGINMFIFSSLIHTVKELRYVWMSFLSTCVLCVELRHMCKMFYTCMHLYFELHACTFLLKMKKSQTISCWFNCYYFREMALEIPRIPHKKTRKYAGMSMSVCFEFTPVSNIIPAFATLGSLQKEIMFLNWFLNDLPFAKRQPVWIWNFTPQV